MSTGISQGINSATALQYLRQTLADVDNSANGRWTDAALIGFIDRANKRVVRDVLFPDSRCVQPTIPGVQLYQFPLMLKVKAIYCAGQLIDPSDLPTLEGRQIGKWDMTADGSTSAGTYSDAPLGAGTGSPQWAVQTPLSYPSTNGQWVTPAPDAQPWDSAQRPRYYWRGGWLGLVPPPANTTPVAITVDGVRQPDTIPYSVDSSGNMVPVVLTTPDNFLDAVVWAACEIAQFANDSQSAARQMQTAEQKYDREKRKLIEWRGEYPGEQRNGPKPSTLRPAYAAYRMRRGGR